METNQYQTRHQVLIAAQTLPAAGAEVDSEEIQTPDTEYVSLYLAYTRGAAGGAVTFDILTSPETSGDHWYQTVAKSANVPAAGADTANNVQREELIYTSVGATQEKFIYGPIEIDKTVERLKVVFKESGVVGTPGDIEGTILLG